MRLIHAIKNVFFAVLCTAFALCGLYACASMGSPSGGDYDIAPPVFVKSTPAPNAINFVGNKIEIYFDELITLEKPSEKVIITPPQKKMPIIKSLGNKVIVELKDSMIPNVTYTFDFTNSIVDNNEKNALEGFSFAFSTGSVIDSLVVAGRLLNAENLEPMPNILIGLHTNLDDTAFTHTAFLRTSQTDDRGRFWVRNVAPGTYRVFALEDANRDYKFDQPGEAIAFYDSLIVPSFEPAVRMDTIWKDSLTVDSIVPVSYTRFTPDDLLLFLFKEKFDQQYFAKSERPDSARLSLRFNSAEGLPPQVSLVDDPEKQGWYINEFSDDRKTITYWITDSSVYKQDTLRLAMTYLATDTLNQMVPFNDTLQLVNRRKEEPKKKGKDKEKIEFLGVRITPQSSADVFDTIRIVFNEPLWSLDTSKVVIEQKVDTLWEKRNFPLQEDPWNARSYFIARSWPYAQEYRITIDSAAITSIYGKWNDKVSTSFKFRAEEEYANLYVKVHGLEGPGFGELLDASDRVVRKVPLKDGELTFFNLKPAKYYLRYIEDWNNNGVWDPGSYADQLQPEPVFYYPSFFQLGAYVEMEHNWEVWAVPIEKQKPLDITKNKPQEKKPKRTDPRSKSNNNTNNNQNSSMSSFGGGAGRSVQQSTNLQR